MSRHLITAMLFIGFLGCHGQRPPIPTGCDAEPKVPRAETKAYETYGVGGLPKFSAADLKQREVVTLWRKGYASGYSEDLKLPLWTAYRVGADNGFRLRRPSKFTTDAETNSRVKADAFNYRETQLSRGHMAPSYGIMSRIGKTDKESRAAQVETFMMSNMCPQRQRLNGGLWSELENKSTQGNSAWGNPKTEVWILCG